MRDVARAIDALRRGWPIAIAGEGEAPLTLLPIETADPLRLSAFDPARTAHVLLSFGRAETLSWLESNGFAELARGAVVVLNASRPGASLVRQNELESHFRTRVRAVVTIPYDAHLATGGPVSYRSLAAPTQQAARELAAVVVEGLRSGAVR